MGTDIFAGRLPDRLRLVDGELVLADGGDVREYLRAYAARAGVTAADPVNVLPRAELAFIVASCGVA